MIVVAVVVLIFVTATAIILSKRRKTHKGNAPIKKCNQAVRIEGAPEGLAFHQTENSGEEIDLEVLSYDGICTEEKLHLPS